MLKSYTWSLFDESLIGAWYDDHLLEVLKRDIVCWRRTARSGDQHSWSKFLTLERTFVVVIMTVRGSRLANVWQSLTVRKEAEASVRVASFRQITKRWRKINRRTCKRGDEKYVGFFLHLWKKKRRKERMISLFVPPDKKRPFISKHFPSFFPTFFPTFFPLFGVPASSATHRTN